MQRFGYDVMVGDLFELEFDFVEACRFIDFVA